MDLLFHKTWIIICLQMYKLLWVSSALDQNNLNISLIDNSTDLSLNFNASFLQTQTLLIQDNRSGTSNYLDSSTWTINKRNTVKLKTSNGIQKQLLNDADSQPFTVNPCSALDENGEIIVTCTGLQLENVNPDWFPAQTTSLYLNQNSLETILNVTFSKLKRLRYLDLSNNKILSIQTGSFRELDALEYLNLEFNNLNFAGTSYPSGVFAPLGNLKKLLLRKNTIEDLPNQQYPEELFANLSSLQSLTIDTCSDTLFFPLAFLELQNLTRLEISGNVKHVNNISFTNVPHIRELVISEMESISTFSDDALQPMKDLDKLSFLTVYIGVEKALAALKPFVGKNMTSILFDTVPVGKNDPSPGVHSRDTILDANKTTHLRGICVENFALRKSQVSLVEINSLRSAMWQKCLRTFNMSLNPLIGSRPEFLYLVSSMPRLEEFVVEDCLRTCNEYRSFANRDKFVKPRQISDSKWSGLTGMETSLITRELTMQRVSRNPNARRRCTTERTYKETANNGLYTFNGGENLRIFRTKRFIRSFHLDFNYYFNAPNLQYLDIQDSGFTFLQHTYIGFDSLKMLFASGNDFYNISSNIFDSMCNLEELYLSNCNLNATFISSQSARIFKYLFTLKRLDMSHNSLSLFKPNTFFVNNDLEEMDLSRNRFNSIPFSLKNTPRLVLLDIRDNSIINLEAEVTSQLDELAARNTQFSLFLSGNILSCQCSSIPFLKWLRTTRVTLDQGGNYTCLTTNGDLTFTRNYEDLEVLWRQCVGGFFLSLSLVLFSATIIGYLSVFLVWRNSTFIKAVLVNALLGNKLKPIVYRFDVFIGYANSDYRFACFTLEKFLRERLHLSTYIYHRDQIPSIDMANSIMQAINNSRKTLLVMSHDYLSNNHEWAQFTTRCAVYAQNPTNPSRVVVLVEDKQRHRLPLEVLGSVNEDNILVLEGMKICYELKEMLRTRLANR